METNKEVKFKIHKRTRLKLLFGLVSSLLLGLIPVLWADNLEFGKGKMAILLVGAVSCGLFAYRLHRNYTVKYPLQLRRGHLFTTPSLTLRVPRTKGAFALCLRLERPHHNISAFHSLRNAGRQRRHLGQHSKSSPGAGELLGESRITFCGRGRPCQERKQP